MEQSAKRLVFIAAIFTGYFMATGASAQLFPGKPILVTPTFGLVGGPEIALRLIVEDITKRTSQKFVIESRPGGLGSVGLSALQRAEPDGSTIAYTFTGALLVTPYTTPGLGWDPLSFAPIARIYTSPILLVSDPKFPAKDMADVLRLAKQNSETVSVSLAGAGNKIGLAQIEAATGVKFLWVPVTSTPHVPLLGGHVNLAIETPSTVRTLIEAGKLRAIAMGSLQRTAYMPDVPTIAETVPGIESGFWFGFLAPKRTPDERIDWLNKQINTSLNTPDIGRRLVELGLDRVNETPRQFGEYLAKNSEIYKKIIADFKIGN